MQRDEQAAFFRDDDIIDLLEIDPNELFAPLARLCETLGLDEHEEAELLAGHAVLSGGLQALGRDGQGLRVDLVPLWLLMLDASLVAPEVQDRLRSFQREGASILWQAWKPQGFGSEDALLPERAEMQPVEQAYQGMMAQATLSRQQMLIERQIEARRAHGNRMDGAGELPTSGPAFELARAVRRVAADLSMRTRRNEYGGVYNGLQRQFGIESYRNMPRGRLIEAMEWLERWHGDILGEPEPPPDI